MLKSGRSDIQGSQESKTMHTIISADNDSSNLKNDGVKPKTQPI